MYQVKPIPRENEEKKRRKYLKLLFTKEEPLCEFLKGFFRLTLQMGGRSVKITRTHTIHILYCETISQISEDAIYLYSQFA